MTDFAGYTIEDIDEGMEAPDRAKKRATLACTAHVGDAPVIDGEALAMAPSCADRDNRA